MIKVGQIYQLPISKTLIIVTRIVTKKDKKFDEIYLLNVNGITKYLWRNVVESFDLLAEYNTWQEAVGSKEFKGEDMGTVKDNLEEKIYDLQKENAKLKNKNIKLTEIVDILSSGDVGNLCYKIKNQRHEINNRLKEIDKLKELLKECKPYVIRNVVFTSMNRVKEVDLETNDLLTKIDEVLK